MARLNTRPSSRYESETPGRTATSDQENQDPRPRMENGKGRAFDKPASRASLPTPSSYDSESDTTRGQKRKRGAEQPREAQSDEEGSSAEEARFNRYFDPNQDPEERREVKRKSRALEREFHETRDGLLRDSGTGLRRTVRLADEIYRGVKQTNDATLDSRLLVNVSDLAYKKTAQLVLGDSSTGVDVDEFLSKCITYMRNGGPIDREQDEEGVPNPRRRRRNRDRDDSDDEGNEDSEPLDWAFLGLHACFPYNSRPCVPPFLLGPLSVEKKHRSQTQRRARQAKDGAQREARPEALSREDLSRSDENTLTAICKRINSHLIKHVQRAETALEQAGFTSIDELHTQRGKDMLKKYRVSDTGGPSLFDYVLNPRSFGQTVENLFYVSFLIKEGTFGVQHDSQGLPTVVPSEPSTLEQQRANKTSKHQAVFSIDYSTWQELIEAFDVHEPLIEHRREDDAAAVGQRGWYV